MGYHAAIHAQDVSSGRVEAVLRALTRAASAADDYTLVDVAVAYASTAGVRLLEDRLTNPRWDRASKRFLVSIDFGITQPQALDRIAQLSNSEVRIPNASQVLASPSLLPRATFHAKAFIFRGASWSESCASVMGSANLTASALATGSEIVVGQSWSSRPSRSERRQLQTLRDTIAWFDDAWATSVPWCDIRDAYRDAYRGKPRPRKPPEERTPAVRQYLKPTAGPDVSSSLTIQLANARHLWIDAGAIPKNRGPKKPGNQLDTPRGTRVFFGFESTRVPKNHNFGKVQMRVRRPGTQFVERSVRFGNNEMDKINLPIPEQNGLDSYDHSYLLFTRLASDYEAADRFELDATDERAIRDLKSAAVNSIDLTIASGRRYGLIF